LRRSINRPWLKAKDFTGELFDPKYLNPNAGVSSGIKGEANGLESTQDRRSAGRHGNQHVYVRYPQVSGSVVSDFAQVDLGPDTFPMTERCLR
jgi:hypothetical protein